MKKVVHSCFPALLPLSPEQRLQCVTGRQITLLPLKQLG